jgi:hypothetical protein
MGVSDLDLLAGRLVVVDLRNNQAYPIMFEPALLPMAQKLHQGSECKGDYKLRWKPVCDQRDYDGVNESTR